MALRTTGSGSALRIITKTVDGEVRASCECCAAAGCCMYPADQLGIGYAEADLPDSITIIIDGAGGDTRIATKSGSEYVYGSYGAIPNLKFGVTDDAWQFIPNADNLSSYSNPCLLDTLGGTSEAEFTIDDNFEDTYTVEFLDGKQVTVTRDSLCFWSGTATIDGFEYEASLTYNDETFQWELGFSTVDISSGFSSKDGNQNTPVGTYSGDNVITVS